MNTQDTTPPSLSSATLQVLAMAERAGSQPAEMADPPCPDLAKAPRILDRFRHDIAECGVVGEDRAAQLVYLIMTSRILEEPVSAALKGPSGAGKNYVPMQTLRFFPKTAYYVLSAMSERSLAYSQEPLSYRILVLYEAAGLSGNFATYLLRTLLSEGCIRYETVEPTKDGLRPRLITRKGPTGLLISTTAVRLHPENETRLLSIPISDSQEQTQRVFEILAEGSHEQPDLSEWLALQLWLEKAEHRVFIPYATELAAIVPPVAVRLRRDFRTVLSLIKTHAILHQINRDKDVAGRIVASLEDYAIIRELVGDLLAEGVGLTVSSSVRETVAVVHEIVKDKRNNKWATLTEVANTLGIDKSSASRRVKASLSLGYLVNEEQGRGMPQRLVIGDPLPGTQELLPSPECLDRCTVAQQTEGRWGHG